MEKIERQIERQIQRQIDGLSEIDISSRLSFPDVSNDQLTISLIARIAFFPTIYIFIHNTAKDVSDIRHSDILPDIRSLINLPDIPLNSRRSLAIRMAWIKTICMLIYAWYMPRPFCRIFGHFAGYSTILPDIRPFCRIFGHFAGYSTILPDILPFCQKFGHFESGLAW